LRWRSFTRGNREKAGEHGNKKAKKEKGMQTIDMALIALITLGVIVMIIGIVAAWRERRR
jgi:heme/copper-type cytochrome/quinol oxidase subunit 2